MKTIITLLLVAFSFVGFSQNYVVDCTNGQKTKVSVSKLDVSLIENLKDENVYIQVAKFYVIKDNWIFEKSNLISLSNTTELQEYCITEVKKEEIKGVIKSQISNW